MRLIESKIVAWTAMLLVVALIIVSFLLRTPWYGFIAEFFCFLAVFSHTSSLYIRRMSVSAAGKLEKCALIFFILAILGFIAEYIVFNVVIGQ